MFMNSKILGAVFLVLLLVSGTAVVSVIAHAQTDNNPTEDKRILSVNGEYIMSIDPDKFVANVIVETQAKTAEESQRQNAQIASKVEKAVGFNHKLTTTSYTIEPVYEWQSCGERNYVAAVPCIEKQILAGYKTVHIYKFDTSDLAKAGTGLDDLVAAGATRIESIRFEISRELQDQLNLQLLEKASENAKVKAQSIAKGFGVTLGQPLTINEDYYYRPVYYDYAYSAGSAEKMDSYVPTTITAGQIDLSAKVSVTYEIF